MLVGEAEVKNFHNRRMVQATRADHFQGDHAVEGEMPCLVDHAHAAFAEFLQQLVVGNPWQVRLRVPGII